MDVKKEIRTTRELVEELLREDPKCRNSDLWLILQVWQKKQHIKCFVPYECLKDMILPETISRVRRQIQNKERRFPPTSEFVRRKRRMREKIFQTEMLDF